MAGVLKENAAVKEYWLEPGSRRVEPVKLSVTDFRGRRLEDVDYSADAALEVHASATRWHGILIDFGKEVGGYPHLAFGTGRCHRVGVQAAESLEHLSSPLVAGPASIADRSLCVTHVWARAGRTADLQHFGGFRYLWIYPKMPGAMTLGDVWIDYSPHIPGDPDTCGYFLSSDDMLNRAWFAGLHTIEMCTVDPALGGYNSKGRIGVGEWVLVDGAKRDRLIWAGDLLPMANAVFVSDNNTAAVRDSLLSLATYQENNGYIPACSPGPVLGRVASGFFGDYVAWWVVCLHSYYLHTGDLDTLEEMLPVVKRALHYLHSQCRGGLFRQTPLNMMEWCFTVLRQGRPTYTNVMYYWALNCASFLAHELGEEEISAGYVSRAFRLSEAMERSLWDEKRGAFVDTTADRGRVPQDGNSLAIVSGLVGEPSLTGGMLEYLKENMWVAWGSNNIDVPYYRLTPGHPPHNRRVFPFMNNFEALARFTAGDADGAMELIRRCWGNMVDSEPGSTFWEWAGRDGRVDPHFCSLCHGWSAGVVPLLSKNVLGIRPAQVAYRSFHFAPTLGDLDWVEGRVPVPGGFIEARVEKRKKGGVDMKCVAPRGIERE